MLIPRQIEQYCTENGYTEPQWVDGRWWAFPCNGVMPVPLPNNMIATTMPISLGVDASAFNEAFREAARSLPSLRVDPNFQPAPQPMPPINRFTNPFVNIDIQPLVEAAAQFRQSAERLVALTGGKDSNFLDSIAEKLATISIPRINLDDIQDFEEAAIDYLYSRYQLPRYLGRIRLIEFCQQHELDARSVYVMLMDGRVWVRHGVICPGRGFRSNDAAKNY